MRLLLGRLRLRKAHVDADHLALAHEVEDARVEVRRAPEHHAQLDH
jgi:hypothetical protein